MARPGLNYNRALLRSPDIEQRVQGVQNAISAALRTYTYGKPVYFRKSWGASAVIPVGNANRAAIEIKGRDNALVAVVEVRGRFKPVIHVRSQSAFVGENVAKALKAFGEFMLAPKVKKHRTIESQEKLLGIRR